MANEGMAESMPMTCNMARGRFMGSRVSSPSPSISRVSQRGKIEGDLPDLFIGQLWEWYSAGMANFALC